VGPLKGEIARDRDLTTKEEYHLETTLLTPKSLSGISRERDKSESRERKVGKKKGEPGEIGANVQELSYGQQVWIAFQRASHLAPKKGKLNSRVSHKRGRAHGWGRSNQESVAKSIKDTIFRCYNCSEETDERREAC